VNLSAVVWEVFFTEDSRTHRFLIQTFSVRGLGELKRRGMGSFFHRGFEDTSFPDTSFISQ